MNFLPMLAITFVILKLCSVITWSWWVVLLPLYALPALFIGCWFVVVCLALIVPGAKVTYHHPGK